MNVGDIELDDNAQIRLAIGGRVRSRRKFLQLSQAGLAERLGVSQETVSQIEIGNRTLAADDLPKIAATLGVRVENLFGEFPSSNAMGSQVVLTDAETKMVDLFRDISEPSRLLILDMIRALHTREHGL